MPVGHPVVYEPADKLRLGLEACAKIAEGDSVSAACRAAGISWQRLWEWKATMPELADAYTHAREMRTELDVERLQRVADGTDQLGDLAEQCADLEASEMEPKFRQEFLRSFDANRIQRDKLRVESLKWTASKRAPKDYGDRIDVTSANKPLAAAQTIIIGGQKVEF